MARVVQFDTEMLANGYTPSEAMIYWYLRLVNYKVGWNWDVRPSIWLMVKTLHLSRRTIINWIQVLEQSWLINVERWYKIKNYYYIVDMHQFPACSSRDDSDWD